MASNSWWQQIFQKIPHSPARRKKSSASTRLMELESLENRLVPATILVTNHFDGNVSLTLTGPSHNTADNLRSAVAIANSLHENSTIILDTGTYQLHSSYGSNGGEVLIKLFSDASLTIERDPGLTGVSTIDANRECRLFEVYGGSVVTMDHLKLTHGLADKNAATDGSEGGAILNHGNLTLTNDFISYNEARGYGGLYGALPGEGGGIYTDTGATLKITDSTIDHNTAYGGDGNAVSSFATNAAGGGLYIENAGVTPDKVDITGSTFSCNRAQGGAFTGGEGSSGFAGNAFGGAVAEGSPDSTHTVNIYNSTFDHNTAQGGSAQKTFSRLSLYGNFGVYGGSAFGGALQIDSLAANSLNNIVNSTFANNNAYGGDASNASHNGYGSGTSFTGGNAYGGAIHVDSLNSQPIKLVNDTIALNHVGYGGGINAYGGHFNGSAGGGGIDTSSMVATKGSPGDPVPVKVLNTIIAKNTNTSNAADDVRGTFTDLGHNFIGYGGAINGFTDSTDQFGDPGLDPAGLKDNGGPTKTITLRPTSHAINQGDDRVFDGTSPAGIPALKTDQRGFSRKIGCDVDVGAVEFELNQDYNNSFQSSATQSVTFSVPAPGLLQGITRLGLKEGESYEVVPICNYHQPDGVIINVKADGSFTVTVPPGYNKTVQFMFHLRIRCGGKTIDTNLCFTATLVVTPASKGRFASNVHH